MFYKCWVIVSGEADFFFFYFFNLTCISSQAAAKGMLQYFPNQNIAAHA